ncbi:hypothetical protein E5D57_005951 [Metarhizium anisopliae]|nr:hypothetical protein E5D57_005951 [Metarhizium anisopliae]
MDEGGTELGHPGIDIEEVEALVSGSTGQPGWWMIAVAETQDLWPSAKAGVDSGGGLDKRKCRHREWLRLAATDCDRPVQVTNGGVAIG